MPKTRGQTAIENRSSDSDEEFTDTRVAGTAADNNMAAASPTTTDRRDTNMITMSEDQLSRILASVMRGSTQPPAAGVHAVHTAQSNFTRCTARFDGAACNADVVEAFIESVLVYKECAGVSDDHALRGLPMLLTGDAAVWWRGVRPTVESWDDALRRLRFMYGAARPAHRVLRDIFATEQQSESADVYISRVRANISRLPYPLPQQMQLDIVYGLLHRRIRKRVPRDSVSSVDCLLERARYVEEMLGEANQSSTSSHNNNTANTNLRDKDNPSNATGKNINPQTAAVKNVNPQTTTSDSSSNIDSSSATSKRVRPRCARCKRFGHTTDECKSKGNELACYGCGREGVIRSKCPTCKGKCKEDAPAAAADGKVSFQSAYTHDSSTSQPTINIEVASLLGVAVLDTGATESLASPGLYAILLKNGTSFTSARRTIGLADGTQHTRDVLLCDTNVVVRGRIVPTTFIVIPGAENRTLLGQDFITKSGILLDLQRGCWYFSDSTKVKVPFVRSYSLMSTSDAELMQVNTTGLALRENEGSKLSPAQRTQLNQLIISKAARFATEGPATSYATHHIRVGERQEPTASPPYRMSAGKKQLLDGELEKLLRADVIEECESPWAANVVLVKKKDGGVRLCVDYRKLNAVTEPDRYPLPRIEDVLHAAKTTAYMSTLDLHSGYFQVSVAEEDRDKTAFITPSGTYRFKRMPMGLRNSGATFQRLIDRFRSNLVVPARTLETSDGAVTSSDPRGGGRSVSILGYLDDLIVLSPTFEEHLEDLEAVFDRLDKFNLRVNRKKSCFACDSVRFLGHIIVPGGLQVDPEKTSAIADMPAPKNERQLKGFLATSSWFRRFVPNYAAVAKPLTDLLKKNSSWRWHEEQQAAFEHIKRLLVTAPILRQADESKPFSLNTDSSGYCLGAVLMQGEGPDERPVEYASRLLLPAERNYTTTEREALAVVWAVTKFRGYIEGSEVIVKSDHQPLRWLMSLKSPSGRLARWALTLQAYNLQIQYTPGKVNVIADTLSRPACCERDPGGCEVCLVTVDIPHRAPADVRDNQLKDPELKTIVEDLEDSDPSRGRGWSERGYLMSDGVLYRCAPEADDADSACLVVPSHEREGILADFHDAPTAGHFGVERTLQRIRARYFWVGMRTFVADYIRRCAACQRYKADNKKPAGLLQTPAATRRFEVVSVDLFGPLPKTAKGNRWILIIEDVCTHWVELFALETATSVECAEILIGEVFLRFGVPRRMVSDNGVQFVAEVMQQACHVMGIKQSLTPLYHPESNPVERKNRDLKPQLAILVGKDHASWDRHLAAIRFAMNSAVTASTGFSPAFLTFGRELRAPSDVVADMKAIVDNDNFVPSITPYLRRLSTALLDARDVHEQAQSNRKKYADEGRRTPPDYKVGDLVLLKTQSMNDAGRGQTAKFIPRRDGPYRIREVVSPTTYVIEGLTRAEHIGRYHVSHLTPFVGDIVSPVREKRKRGRPRKFDASPNARALCPN